MLTDLRRALNGALSALPTARRPSVRRAPEEDWLFSSDVPRLTDEKTLRAFIARLTEEGWRCEARGGLLWLDHAIPVPEAAASKGALPPGERGCAVSLLRRHPGGPWDMRAARAIAKAAEQGGPSLERLCRQLHLAWAAGLRAGTPLPSALLPLLEAACRQNEKEEGR